MHAGRVASEVVLSAEFLAADVADKRQLPLVDGSRVDSQIMLSAALLAANVAAKRPLLLVDDLDMAVQMASSRENLSAFWKKPKLNTTLERVDYFKPGRRTKN